MAADTFSSFLVSLPTLVDICTLPPLLLSVWLRRTWVGLRMFRLHVTYLDNIGQVIIWTFQMFRFFMLMNLPDVLVYIRLIEKSSSIRAAQVCNIWYK